MEKAPILGKIEAPEEAERVEPVFDLEELKIGETLIVKTKSGITYRIESRDDGLYISGHPEYCPTPIKTSIYGVDLNGELRKGEVGLGFKLGFSEQGGPVTRSRILEIVRV